MMMQCASVFAWLGFLVICPSLISASCFTCGSNTSVLSHWMNNFNAEFSIPITSKTSGGWNVVLEFSKPVTNFKIWNSDVESTNNDSSLYILKNKHWNANLNPGSTLQMDFLGQFGEPMPTFTARLIGQEDCGSCAGHTTPATPNDVNTTPTPVVTTPLGCRTCCSSAEVTHEWPGFFDGKFVISIENQVISGWIIELVFSSPVSNLQVYDAIITDNLNGGTIYRLKNKHYNADLAADTYLIQRLQASTVSTPSFTAHIVGQPECCMEDPPSCSLPTTPPPSLSTVQPDLDCPTTKVIFVWEQGFKGQFWIPIRNEVSGGWNIQLDFSEQLSKFEAYRADIKNILNDGKTYILKNKDYNANLAAGTLMIEQFMGSAVTTPTFTARMIGQPDCSSTPSTVAPAEP